MLALTFSLASAEPRRQLGIVISLKLVAASDKSTEFHHLSAVFDRGARVGIFLCCIEKQASNPFVFIGLPYDIIVLCPSADLAYSEK
jgi:hypothetical protein